MRSNRLEARLRKAGDILKPKRPRIIDILRRIPPNYDRQPTSPSDAAERIVEATEAKYDAFTTLFNLSADLSASMALKSRQELAYSLMLMLREESSVARPNWNDVNDHVDPSALEEVQLGDLASDPILFGLYHDLVAHGTSPVIALQAALLCTQDFRARARLSVRFLDATSQDLRRQVLAGWPRDEDTEHVIRLIYEDRLRDERTSPSTRDPHDLAEE